MDADFNLFADESCEPEMWFLAARDFTERNWEHFGCNAPFTRQNEVVALVDGSNYMFQLAALLSKVSDGDYVNIVGWNVNKDMLLPGNETASKFIDLLAQVIARGAKVRALINHFSKPLRAASFLLKFPGQNGDFVDALCKLGAEAYLDNRYVADINGSHHQKSILLSVNKTDYYAFVGGIDIADDRFDDPRHLPPDQNPLRTKVNMDGWHDIQCQVRGSAVRQIWANFAERWNDTTPPDSAKKREIPVALPMAEEPPEVYPGTQCVQVLRTYACKPAPDQFPFAPEGEHTVRAGLLKAIKQAKNYIYIEDQYFWGSELLYELASTPSTVQIILVLSRDMDIPGQNSWQQQTRQDAFNRMNEQRVSAYHLQHVNRDSVIYVHSKLMIIDDRYVSIGSANMAYRSTTTDSELTLAIVDSATTQDGTMGGQPAKRCKFARDLRKQLWAEHLGVTLDNENLDDPIVALTKLWPNPAQSTPKKPLRCHHVVCHHTTKTVAKLWKNIEPTAVFNPRTDCKPK